MEKQEMKYNEEGKYFEYKGVVLPYEVTEKQTYGEYDFFDMDPHALSGGSQYEISIKIGELKTGVVCDIDNIASFIHFYAKDCEDGKGFEVIMAYDLSRGGRQERNIGRVDF